MTTGLSVESMGFQLAHMNYDRLKPIVYLELSLLARHHIHCIELLPEVKVASLSNATTPGMHCCLPHLTPGPVAFLVGDYLLCTVNQEVNITFASFISYKEYC